MVKPDTIDEKSVQTFLAGIIEPSEIAYADSINEEGIDLQFVTVVTTTEQPYGDVATTSHELKYKGKTVWKTPGQSECTSTCRIGQQCVEIALEKKWTDPKTRRQDHFRRRKVLDIDSLIRGSAAAYQMYSTEEELEKYYTILNATDSLDNESFSEYIVEVRDDDASVKGGRGPVSSKSSIRKSLSSGEGSDKMTPLPKMRNRKQVLDQTRNKSLMDDEMSVSSDIFDVAATGFLNALSFISNPSMTST